MTAAATTPQGAAPAAAEPSPEKGLPPIFQSRLRTGTTQPIEEPKPSGEGDKQSAEGKPSTDSAKAKDAKAGDQPAAPAAGAQPEGDTTKKTPAKRTIRVAKDYVDSEADRKIGKLTENVDKLASVVEKVAKRDEVKEAAKEPQLNLSEEEQRDLAIFEVMAEFGDEYKKLADSSRKLLTDLPNLERTWEENLRRTWERKHKDDDFESDDAREAAFKRDRDAAYDDFFEQQKKSYGVTFKASDYRDAEVLMVQRKRGGAQPAPEVKKLEATVQQLESEKRRKEIEPIAEETSKMAANDFGVQLGTADTTLAGVIDETGALVKEKLDALPDAEIVEPIVSDAVSRVKDFSSWITRAFNGDDFIAHRRAGMTEEQFKAAQMEENKKLDSVYGFCLRVEQDILSRPPEDQVVDGKKFATREAYIHMTPAERAHHWIIDAETVITSANDYILAGAVKQIKAGRDQISKVMERHGTKLGVPRVKAAESQPKPAPTPVKAASAKPDMVTSTDTPPSGAGGSGSGSSWAAGRFKERVIASGMTQKNV